MGYAFMTSRCGMCGNMFTYHPNYVPSLNNVPFCRRCVESANIIRVQQGLTPHSIHPRAYDIANEEELA